MNANTNSASPSAPPGSEIDPTLDPTDWEARYQTGDTPWEKGESAPPLISFLSRHAVRGSVLIPGSEEGPPFGVSKEEIARLFDADFDLLESWVPEQTFPGREGRELCQLWRKKDRGGIFYHRGPAKDLQR